MLKVKKNKPIKTTENINIYRNRFNPYVLQRKIEYEVELLKKRTATELSDIQSQIDQLNKRFKKPKTNINDIVSIKSHKRNLFMLHKKYNKVSRSEEIFRLKTNLLKPNNISSLVVVSNSTQIKTNEIFYQDPDRCSKCGKLYVFEPVSHLNICQSIRCKNVFRVLMAVEDKQTDIIAFKNQKLPLLLINYPETTVVKEQRNSIDRAKAYREYIMQYIDTSPPIPDFVKLKLYDNFNNIHLLNSLRCKPSSVANVLKNESKEFQQYVAFSNKIAKEFNGDAIPKLSLDLIEKLCIRFKQISEAALSIPDFGKLPSVEILTHSFLRTEQRDDLAIFFQGHKDDKPLRLGDIRMRQLIEICRKKSSNWEMVPHCG